MEDGRALLALINEPTTLTPKQVRRLMNSSRHIAHASAGSRAEYRPTEARVIGKAKRKRLLRKHKCLVVGINA